MYPCLDSMSPQPLRLPLVRLSTSVAVWLAETGVTLPLGDPTAIITMAKDVSDKSLDVQRTDNIKQI